MDERREKTTKKTNILWQSYGQSQKLFRQAMCVCLCVYDDGTLADKIYIYFECSKNTYSRVKKRNIFKRLSSSWSHRSNLIRFYGCICVSAHKNIVSFSPSRSHSHTRCPVCSSFAVATTNKTIRQPKYAAMNGNEISVQTADEKEREREKSERTNEQTAKLKSLDENDFNVFFFCRPLFWVEIQI